eukprot:COSAG01_NODE_11349_length_1953_cov_1.968716_1_plen_500_part_00
MADAELGEAECAAGLVPSRPNPWGAQQVPKADVEAESVRQQLQVVSAELDCLRGGLAKQVLPTDECVLRALSLLFKQWGRQATRQYFWAWRGVAAAVRHDDVEGMSATQVPAASAAVMLDHAAAERNAGELRARTKGEEARRAGAKTKTAEGYGHLFRAAGITRERDWQLAKACFEQALILRPDAGQAAKGLAELDALSAAEKLQPPPSPPLSGNNACDGAVEPPVDGPIRALIVDWRVSQLTANGLPASSFVQYSVSVQGEGVSRKPQWRRFSEFKGLHRTLSKQLSHLYHSTSAAATHLFAFSVATWFDTLDKGFVERRRHWLGQYLQDITSSPAAMAHEATRIFLSLGPTAADVGGMMGVSRDAVAPSPYPAALAANELNISTADQTPLPPPNTAAVPPRSLFSTPPRSLQSTAGVAAFGSAQSDLSAYSGSRQPFGPLSTPRRLTSGAVSRRTSASALAHVGVRLQLPATPTQSSPRSSRGDSMDEDHHELLYDR